MSARGVEAVLAAHEYRLQHGRVRGGICDCGFVPDVDPESLRTQQDYHRAHVAAEIRAWLLAPEQVERARDAVQMAYFEAAASPEDIDHLYATAALTAVLGGGDDE